MATYFTGKYQEYYDSLADEHYLGIQAMSLENTVSEVKAEFGAESPFTVFCEQGEKWIGRANSAYNLPGTLSDAAHLNVGTRAEKLYKSMFGKDLPLTIGTGYKLLLKHSIGD